jgi:hypothetical protein
MHVSINRFDAKRDSNEIPIIDALEAAGYWVVRLNQPVDLLVGRRGYERFALMEVKNLGKKLTEAQVRFFQQSEGSTRFIVHTPHEALTVADMWIFGGTRQ